MPPRHTASELLDAVRSPAQLAALVPATFAELLAAELPPASTAAELAARDARLRDALAQIDAFTERAMRVHLDHALVDDAAIPMATRKVFAGTIVRYADAIELLVERARDVARRAGTGDAATRVEAAARASLALRAALRAPVLALVGELAAAAVPGADHAARERARDDDDRRRWSAVRRELAAVAAAPTRIEGAAFADRLADHPAQLDEPAAVPEPSFGELLELD